jgi:hypothetical protein
MNLWRKILFLILKTLFVAILAGIAWWIYVLAQQWSYSKKDQLYLVGTNASYLIAYIFIFVVIFFILSFIHHRNHPQKLKKRFIIFTLFYLLSSPFVIFGFDNYLLITPKGIQYNQFFDLEGSFLREWKDIDQLILDYEILHKPTRTHKDLRLKFILQFKDGSQIDLNNYNSPLYKGEEFVMIYRALVKAGVTVKVNRPLPKEFSEPKSYLYELFPRR